MKTKRIVLASLLKPVDDPRMYYKFAKSLASDSKYEINIIGFPSKQQVYDPDIHFHPLIPFRRKSFDRWHARIQASRLIWKLRPDLLIFNTHELLAFAIFMRIFTGARIVYDVRENYAANLRHRKTLLSGLFSITVRLKELIAAPFTDYFFLAEISYINELSFIRNRYSVLENKALKPQHSLPRAVRFATPPLKFLFTGTLAEQTGTLEAISMIEHYRKVIPEATLHLAGNSFDPDFMARLNAMARERPWITTDADEFPIPYPQILTAIQEAEVGIIAYEDAAFLRDKHPTKFFEYTGNHLPILYTSGSPWAAASEPYSGGIQYTNNTRELIKHFANSAFYPSACPDKIYWISEHNDLLRLIKYLLYADYK